MTTFSKILALFTTAACFAFLGFVTVSLIAGPNWAGETHEFPDYAFEYSGGENPTWSVKSRDNDQAVGGGSPVLPKKIVDVLNAIKQEQQAEITLLDEGDPQKGIKGINQLDDEIHNAETGIEVLLYKDIAALNQYRGKLVNDLERVQTANETTSREVTNLVTTVEGIYLEAERRRADIYRLQNLVAEAETDRYRAVEHQKKLRDVWERYQGVKHRLKERNQILQEQLKQKQRRYEEPAEM